MITEKSSLFASGCVYAFFKHTNLLHLKLQEVLGNWYLANHLLGNRNAWKICSFQEKKITFFFFLYFVLMAMVWSITWIGIFFYPCVARCTVNSCIMHHDWMGNSSLVFVLPCSPSRCPLTAVDPLRIPSPKTAQAFLFLLHFFPNSVASRNVRQ